MIHHEKVSGCTTCERPPSMNRCSLPIVRLILLFVISCATPALVSAEDVPKAPIIPSFEKVHFAHVPELVQQLAKKSGGKYKWTRRGKKLFIRVSEPVFFCADALGLISGVASGKTSEALETGLLFIVGVAEPEAALYCVIPVVIVEDNPYWSEQIQQGKNRFDAAVDDLMHKRVPCTVDPRPQATNKFREAMEKYRANVQMPLLQQQADFLMKLQKCPLSIRELESDITTALAVCPAEEDCEAKWNHCQSKFSDPSEECLAQRERCEEQAERRKQGGLR